MASMKSKTMDGKKTEPIPTLTKLRKRGVGSVSGWPKSRNGGCGVGITDDDVRMLALIVMEGGPLLMPENEADVTQTGCKAIRWIYKTVTEKNPLQLKFRSPVDCQNDWASHLQEIWGEAEQSSVCRLLVNWRLTPQRPYGGDTSSGPEEVQNGCRRSIHLDSPSGQAKESVDLLWG